MGNALKGKSGLLMKAVTLIALLGFAAVLSAKADDVISGSFTGNAGSASCTSGMGTLDINSSGDVNFVSANGYCYFGGDLSSTVGPFSSTNFSTFLSSLFYSGSTHTGGTAANLFALATGTYYESGQQCDASSSCNPKDEGFSVVITSTTITLDDVLTGGSITVNLANTPEPSSLLLLGSGLLSLAGAGIFRKKPVA